MHLAIKSAETTQDANRTSISNEDGDDNSKEDHHHHLETPTKSVSRIKISIMLMECFFSC